MVTREERIAALEAKLRVREGRPGLKDNCEALRAEIARLKGGGE